MSISVIKRSLLSLGILATTVLLAACGSKSSDQGSTKLASNQKISLSTTAEITSLDLSKIYDKTSFIQIDETFEGLYRYDANGNVEPALDL